MSEKDKNKNLENFISKSLNSIHDEPSGSVWEGLDTRLSAHERNQKKGFAWWPFWGLLLGLGMMAILGFSFFKLNQKINILNQQLTEQSTQNEQLEKEIQYCQDNKLATENEIKFLENKLNETVLSASRFPTIPHTVFYEKKSPQNNFLPTKNILPRKEEQKEIIHIPEISNIDSLKNTEEKNPEEIEISEQDELLKKETELKIEGNFENELSKNILEEKETKNIKQSPWSIGAITNNGWTKFGFAEDYHPHLGMAIKYELPKQWSLISGISYGWSDYELFIPENLNENQINQLIAPFPPAGPPPPVLQISDLKKIDVHWGNIDFLFGLQKQWQVAPMFNLYAESIFRPSLEIHRHYSYIYENLSIPINNTENTELEGAVFYPLNMELGTGLQFNFAKKWSGQIGFYYQPALSEYGDENQSYSVMGIKSALWFDVGGR